MGILAAAGRNYASGKLASSSTTMSQPAQPGVAPEKEVAVPHNNEASGSGLPKPAVASPPKRKIHPAIIITIWIALSSSVIVYNKYVHETNQGRA